MSVAVNDKQAQMIYEYLLRAYVETSDPIWSDAADVIKDHYGKRKWSAWRRLTQSPRESPYGALIEQNKQLIEDLKNLEEDK